MLDSYAIYTRIDYCIKVDFLFSFVVLPLPFPPSSFHLHLLRPFVHEDINFTYTAGQS